MALTLESEQRLTKAGLVEFFEDARDRWKGFAERSFNYVRVGFPAGATVRQDDAAKAMLPMLEVDPQLLDFLSANRLKERYWIRYFGDLILDRCWSQVANGGGEA